MPILDQEPHVHPANLLEIPELGTESERQWWALYTLARREKDLMRRLRSLDIAFYAPMVARKRRSKGGRIRTSVVPLFSSYVFLYGGAEQRYDAMTTNTVCRWVPVPDGRILTADLRNLEQLIQTGLPVTPEEKLAPGMRVKIRSGPLTGIEGIIERRDSETRLIVAVNFLQKGASVQLADCDVARIH